METIVIKRSYALMVHAEYLVMMMMMMTALDNESGG